MRADEIREMGTDDIASRIRELEEERFRLRFRSATEPLEDPLRLRVIRKDVARLQTVLRERQLGRGTGPTGGAPAAAAAPAASAKRGRGGARKSAGAAKKTASARKTSSAGRKAR